MVYDSQLAERIRPLMLVLGCQEKKMFGGLGFLLNGNMCVGVWKNSLIARVGPDEYDAALSLPGAKEFDITGRAMRGWVLVENHGLPADDDLQQWVQRAIDFVLSLPAKG